MQYPNFVPNPSLMTDECHVFRPGGPVEVGRAPVAIGADGDVFGLPGAVPADAWHVLPHVVEIIHRIVPWSAVYAAPYVVIEAPPDGYPCREFVRRKDCGKDYVKVSGFSFGNEGLIALSMYSWAGYLISTAYHEAWHQVEKILDEKILDEIDSHLIPLSWGSAYLDSMSERRARAFETWAMHFEEGMPPRRIMNPVDEIFDRVATGEVAKEWYKTQQKRAARRGP